MNVEKLKGNNKMFRKYISYLLVLLTLLSSLSANERRGKGEITGAFGLKLGEKFDKKKAVSKEKTNVWKFVGDGYAYQFKPKNPFKVFEYYYVYLTDDSRIYAICADSMRRTKNKKGEIKYEWIKPKIGFKKYEDRIFEVLNEKYFGYNFFNNFVNRKDNKPFIREKIDKETNYDYFVLRNFNRMLLITPLIPNKEHHTSSENFNGLRDKNKFVIVRKKYYTAHINSHGHKHGHKHGHGHGSHQHETKFADLLGIRYYDFKLITKQAKLPNEFSIYEEDVSGL